MQDREVHLLALDLQKLVGWPTKSKATSLARLRRLVGDDADAHRSSLRTFEALQSALHEAIASLDEPLSLRLPREGRIEVSADAAKQAYRQLLALDGVAPAEQESRRSWAIRKLNLNMTTAYWRREGPELVFLEALAARLLRGATEAERYAVDSFDLTYTFDDAGILVAHEHAAQLRALKPQAPYSSLDLTSDWYPGHSFRLARIMGCTVVEQPAVADLPLRLHARGPAVNVGDVLAVSAVFDVTGTGRINRISWQFQNAAERASIRLRFTPPALPADVWWYKNEKAPEEGADRAGGAGLTARGNDYFVEYDHLMRDRWFGVYWRWF